MARPIAKPAAILPVASPAQASVQPVEPAPPAAVSTSPDTPIAPPQFAPALMLPEESRFARAWRPMVLILIVVVTIAVSLWVRPGGDAQRREQADQSFNRGGWSRRSILPPGRLMSVYEPSREESDYRIEFGWVPDARGVGLVVRTRDAGDYYGARVSMLRPGASVVLVAEHFSVFGGVESAHSRRVIPLGAGAGLVRVRMDAIGPAFTLSLQGSPVDYWTDARLISGALGFWDERGQRAVVQALRFTFIKKGVTRIAVASLP